ncbi:uncharacterized protein [Physcomitrium patens]|uniref:Uncharacterized protein n=1 Tax=Physcomitrium patens TaxID=3218 RepID=A9S688_PHYPA|nr:uncharacterized protein LOC112287340 isoform X1 [Physcomitrium patens]PNR46294.1 hypothetical protein PHYPA_013413 [Physcomitrium patens]|eukprot:XP_024386016.1 uncharacterized protein LOC112287340 isoform X1 [Physcomitrella patens]
MSRTLVDPLYYGKPEPVWVTNNRHRLLGTPYQHTPTSSSGAYEFGPYTRGTVLPDVIIRAPLYDLVDVSRIKDVLGVEGVFNVVCDIPAQTITVSSSLSPRTVVNLVRRVMSTAHIINIAEAPPTAVLQPAYTTPVDRTRTTAYDDMYAYEGRSGYVPPYVAPYGGRSYDNEFRPGRYYNY